MDKVAIPRWPFVVLAGVICLAAGCAGAGLGWLGAALYRLDLAGPQASAESLAGMLYGVAGGALAALAWSAAITVLARRCIRDPQRPFSRGKLAFLGLVLGSAAGAAGTAILHGALSLIVFASQGPEAAVWFLGMLVGVPMGGLGGLAGGLAYGCVVAALRPEDRPAGVDIRA